MTTVVIGVDRNASPSSDLAFQDAVAKVLQSAGYKVKKLARDPNAFASYSYGSEAKGKIGIYIIAAGTYSIADFAFGANKSGNSFDYAYFGIRGDLSVRPHSQSEFESAKVGADADCPSWLCSKIAGNTFPKINQIVGNKCKAVFGKSGSEMGQNILNDLSGRGYGTGNSTSSNSGSSNNSGTASKTGSSDVSPLLQGEMSFEELVGSICNGIDLLFLTKRSTVVVDDFESIFAEAKYLRDNHSSVVEGENIKLWQLQEDSYEMEVNQHGFYNTVYVKYKNGTVRESFDEYVGVYGEIPITYNEPYLDKTGAKMKAKAYLAAHIRDFNMSINLSMLTEGDIDIGDIVTVNNPKTLLNDVRINAGRDPEYLFVNGFNTSWEGDSILTSDLELKFAPVSPENSEVPFSGVATGKNKSSSLSAKSSSQQSSNVFDACGVSKNKDLLLSICRPSGGRIGKYSYNSFYATLFENKCPRCGKKGVLRWDSGTVQTHCITCGGYSGSKRTWGNISEGEVSCNGCCSDFDGVTGWEKDGNFSSRLTYAKKPVKSSKKEFNALLKGGYTF